MRFHIIGAGLSGAVIARILAEQGYQCRVFEESDHVAGSCHTERDEKTGILMHCFGPHTLHTDDVEVWNFVERFTEIYPYQHKKLAWVKNKVFPFPINLSAINQFFDAALNADNVGAFLQKQAAPYYSESPENFEQAALASVGARLYEGFYKGYTQKQWGRNPKELPAYIFKRLPLHLSDEQNVYHHKRQGQPIGGYTLMVQRILDHPLIDLKLGVSYDPSMEGPEVIHTFYSGPIDRYFKWCYGELPYRTLDFRTEYHDQTFQRCGSENYCDGDIPFTRITEHKRFWPWEEHKQSVITYEYSRECRRQDRPYYPVHLSEGNVLFERYIKKAIQTSGVSFVGRLGTYRYIDMDVAISQAMQSARKTIEILKKGGSVPAFFFLSERRA